jgi:23S rRNA (guanine745-N1)-methyltransferase
VIRLAPGPGRALRWGTLPWRAAIIGGMTSVDAPLAPPWRCPVCREVLLATDDGRRWVCPAGHSFDTAREGYVNLLVAGQRRSRVPGDSSEMVTARREFLATGAYDPLTDAVSAAVASHRPAVVLDVGCGEGHHTRRVRAPVLLGVDVSKAAVATAARADPAGWYAVASAADLPVADASVDVALDVFGPSMPAEFARVVRPGGWVVAAHPGPAHLGQLRRLVYEAPRPHEVKSPFRHAPDLFEEIGSEEIGFPVVVTRVADLEHLFGMTPYRWHAPTDIAERLAAAVAPTFTTGADIRLTTYRRR